MKAAENAGLEQRKLQHKRTEWEKNAKDARKVLIVSPVFDETICRAARNLGHVLLITAADVNAEHLLRYDKILLTGEALAKISERTSS